MPTLEGTVRRLELDQSSRIGLVETLSEERLTIWQGLTAKLQCSLFDDTPSAETFVTSLSNIDQAELVVRKIGPNGGILFAKTVLVGSMDSTTTYAEWVAQEKQHITFELSPVETSQTVPSSGRLPIYFVITIKLLDGTDYIGGFGSGEIIDVGYIENPAPQDYIDGRSPITGGVLQTALDADGFPIINLPFSGVGYIETGEVPLTPGQVEVNVAFLFQKVAADYVFTSLYVKDTSVTAEKIDCVVNEQTSLGFKLKLIGTPTSVNCTLVWGVAILDPNRASQPGTAGPRYGIVPAEGDIVRYQIWDKGGQFFNVKAYDTPDDAIAAAALVGGGTIFYPPGIYDPPEPITGNGIHILGCGFATQFRNSSTTGPTIQFGTASTQAAYCSISNVTFIPTVTRAADTYEIDSTYGTNIDIDHIKFLGTNAIWGCMKFGHAGASTAVANVSHIRAVDFNRFIHACRFISGMVSHCQTSANRVSSTSVVLDGGCESWVFTKCDFTGGGDKSLTLQAVAYAVSPPRFNYFIGCFFDGAATGIYVSAGDWNFFLGGWASADGLGIHLTGTASNTVISSGMLIYNCTSFSIYVNGASSTFINDTHIYEGDSHGLSITGNSSGVFVAGGSITNNAGNGIFVVIGATNIAVADSVRFAGNALGDINNGALGDPTVIIQGYQQSAPTLQNSWANVGGSYQDLLYYKDATGRVWFSGFITGGTLTLNTVLWTFPVGFRPLTAKVFSVFTSGGVGSVEVLTTGVVRILAAVGPGISFADLSFRTT